MIIEDELPVLDGSLEIRLELEPGHHGSLHLGFEIHVAVLPLALGAVHGDAGVLEKLIAGQIAPAGDANGCSEGHGSASEAFGSKRLTQDSQNALAHQARRVHRSDAVGHDDELVAPQSPESVRLPQHLVEPFGDSAENLVTGVMAEVVVYRFEVIDIDEEDDRLGSKSVVLNQELLYAVDDEIPIG